MCCLWDYVRVFGISPSPPLSLPGLSTDTLLTRLSNRGFAVTHQEVNLLSDGLSCAEFSLVRLDLQCPEAYAFLARAQKNNNQQGIQQQRLAVQKSSIVLPANNRFLY